VTGSDAAKNPVSSIVVAVDGPSGSGKSSVSRAVASSLGLRYLDTGAMYRAVTLWMLTHGVDVQDPPAVAAAVDQVDLTIGTDPRSPSIAVEGIDVSGPIRSDEVTAAVSAVSAVPAVRARLLVVQRSTIGTGGIVVEGRDIGTKVAPTAEVKVFLTASPQARAIRRAAERSANDDLDPSEVQAAQAAMSRRDHLDSSRQASPLARAHDAIEIDATNLTLDEVVARVTTLVLRGADVAWTPSQEAGK
jgi:CMP/dCMP kinase